MIALRTRESYSFHRRLIVLGFNDKSTLVGHFVTSPREREKRDSRGDEKDRGKKKMKENEETGVIKTSSPIHPYLLQGQQALPKCKPVSFGRPGDARYTPLPHLTTRIPYTILEHQKE